MMPDLFDLIGAIFLFVLYAALSVLAVLIICYAAAVGS